MPDMGVDRRADRQGIRIAIDSSDARSASFRSAACQRKAQRCDSRAAAPFSPITRVIALLARNRAIVQFIRSRLLVETSGGTSDELTDDRFIRSVARRPLEAAENGGAGAFLAHAAGQNRPGRRLSAHGDPAAPFRGDARRSGPRSTFFGESNAGPTAVARSRPDE